MGDQQPSTPTQAASHERRPETTPESAMRIPEGCPSKQYRKRPADDRVIAESQVKHRDKRPKSTRYTCKCGRQFVRKDNYSRHTSYCSLSSASPTDKQDERTDDGSTHPDNGSVTLARKNGESRESLGFKAMVLTRKKSVCMRQRILKQQSPFRLPNNKTLDTYYEVRPADKWGEMLGCNVFKCKELPARIHLGFLSSVLTSSRAW